MRVDLATETSGADLDTGWVHERLRWALGGYTAEIRTIRLSFHTSERGVVCRLRAFLRGRRIVEVEGFGLDFDDALRFGAQRARASVARKIDNDRLLRG